MDLIPAWDSGQPRPTMVKSETNPPPVQYPVYGSVKVVDHDFAGEADPDYVNIMLASRSRSFAQTYKIRNSHMLKDVKAAFGRCADVYSRNLGYIYNGQVVEDPHTPEQLRMNNGAVVDVVADSDFTGECSQGQLQDLRGQGFECLSVVNPEESIVVTARIEGGLEHTFRIKPTTELQKVVDMFRGQAGDPTLVFVCNGHALHNRPGLTVEKAELEDGDIIDCHRLSWGGGISSALP
ncbi:hypothetical protein DOTSEDRAFT_54559 [Dothistroma septosporum NZE10]|uniref:Ubiquitin-like domain-containing protein n=1 Tax=Dothistroma septosporum (strain NZE10 / CBS 128990) TaxID=675120 RepID=N1PHM8_DOTSN|nr:hypothetical protein DOTSEDRAFT_54559 [Dothistroma septosporum NZE10]